MISRLHFHPFVIHNANVHLKYYNGADCSHTKSTSPSLYLKNPSISNNISNFFPSHGSPCDISSLIIRNLIFSLSSLLIKPSILRFRSSDSLLQVKRPAGCLGVKSKLSSWELSQSQSINQGGYYSDSIGLVEEIGTCALGLGFNCHRYLSRKLTWGVAVVARAFQVESMEDNYID